MRPTIPQACCLIAFVASATACEWVKMEPGAAQVRVLRADQDVASCHRLGEIAVSVKDRVGPYERNSIAVRDELETLARNEATTLHADSVQPKTEPADGEQRWLAWRCRG
jgi:hypothetical protein